jgi:hypothetical protein
VWKVDGGKWTGGGGGEAGRHQKIDEKGRRLGVTIGVVMGS